MSLDFSAVPRMPDGRTAAVTLQENNAVALLDLRQQPIGHIAG